MFGRYGHDEDDFDELDEDDWHEHDVLDSMLDELEEQTSLLHGVGNTLGDDDEYQEPDEAPETVTRGLGGDDGDPNEEWLDISDPGEWMQEADPTDSEGDFAAMDDADESAAEAEYRQEDDEQDSDTWQGLL